MVCPRSSACRCCGAETQDLQLLADYQALIRLRKDIPALRAAGTRVLWADQASFAYLRGEGDEAICVAFNLSEEPQRIELPEEFRQVRLAWGFHIVEADGHKVQLTWMDWLG